MVLAPGAAVLLPILSPLLLLPCTAGVAAPVAAATAAAAAAAVAASPPSGVNGSGGSSASPVLLVMGTSSSPSIGSNCSTAGHAYATTESQRAGTWGLTDVDVQQNKYVLLVTGVWSSPSLAGLQLQYSSTRDAKSVLGWGGGTQDDEQSAAYK